MSLKKNVFANYVGTSLTVLAPMLALPYYLHALGSNVWGLLSFITTLQALLSLLDAGLSQALVREFAIANSQKYQTKSSLGTILFGFERLYWLFAICLGVMVISLSHQITHYWIKTDQLSLDQAHFAVYSAGALFIFQFPGSIYRSLLQGVQAQVLLNSVMTLGTLVRHIGCVLIVLRWPTLFGYLIWQLSSVAIETFIRGFFAWRVTGYKRSEFFWNTLLIKRMLFPVLGMSVATLLGALVSQMDRLILSGMVSVSMFGTYVIASTLAAGVLQLIYPILNALTPYLVTHKDDASIVSRLNFRYAKILIFIIVILGVIYYIFGYAFLNWWLNNHTVASQVHNILSILLIGTALNSLYTIGYINWIVGGQFLKVLKVNLISLVVTAIFTPILILKYGLIGASFGWITMNLVGLLFSLGWIASNSSYKLK